MSSYEYLKPEEYKKNYINNNGIIDKEKITSAYNFAVETRKLEIELFWQRSNLFWGFVAASFTGYFALLALTDKKPELITLITILGWFVSIVWYLVCRGSKYWQENWEMHIDLLEDEISGPIMDNFIEDDAVLMFKIFREEFLDIVMLYSFKKEEFDGIVSVTIANPKISQVLQSMYQSGLPKEYADTIIGDAVQNTLSKRQKVTSSMIEEANRLLLEDSAVA